MYLPFRASWQTAIRSYRRFPRPLFSFRTASFPRLETQPGRPAPFRDRLRPRLTPGLRSFRVWLRVQTYRCAAAPIGPWLSTVYHVRACKRYYGLMRQSDELRPAWACSACSGRSLPSRAVRLTFPSFLCHTRELSPAEKQPEKRLGLLHEQFQPREKGHSNYGKSPDVGNIPEMVPGEFALRVAPGANRDRITCLSCSLCSLPWTKHGATPGLLRGITWEAQLARALGSSGQGGGRHCKCSNGIRLRDHPNT
jgi:hypothetical protein